MITGAQIRAARAALRLTSADLAERAAVGIQTVKRFEVTDGVPAGRTSTLAAIKSALERAGIEFVGSPEDCPGIRLKAITPIGAEK